MKVSAVYLEPGYLCHAESPTVISTILGSCIAVTMFHPRTRIGSVCHAMLPRNPAPGSAAAFRYVDSSILYMVEKFRTLGIGRDEVETKLFGGADVLAYCGQHGASVGRQNMETAMQVMREIGLRLMVSDVGGMVGRRLRFSTHTGEVLLKRMTGSVAQFTGVSVDSGMPLAAPLRKSYGE